MTAQLLHPQRELLEAFGLGKLDEADAAFVERHLAECRECCQTLSALQDDMFVELVRGAGEPSQQVEADWAAGDAPSCGDVAAPTGAAASPSLPPELADHPRYRVLELLGRGGMGEVYKAEHRLMNRPVALKVVSPRLLHDARAAERFRREVQAAARLAHPNIVAAYDAEQAGDLHFLAMEYVEGIDSAHLVRRRGPLPVPEACEYIRQAAKGLQHAHDRGMVHRDIKPQNLMLAARGGGVGDQRLEVREKGGTGSRESGIRGQKTESNGSIAGDKLVVGVPQLECGATHPSAPVIKVLDFGLARFATEAASRSRLPGGTFFDAEHAGWSDNADGAIAARKKVPPGRRDLPGG